MPNMKYFKYMKIPLDNENGNVTSHLSGILYRNSSMIEKDIKPIYVFDGQSSELKSDTQAKRREIREESEKIYKEAIFKFDEMISQIHLANM